MVATEIRSEIRSEARSDIRALTGLRGAASLWVAAYHLLLPGALVGGAAARVLGRGYLAVDLFFVLSGFVLALNYGSGFAGPGFGDWGILRAMPGFLWRRWARIFPLYGAILLARLGYTAWRYHGFALPRPWVAAPVAHPWTAIPANLALVQSWGVAPSIVGPAWSVSTEWAAYWVFPLLAVVLLHRRPGLALAGAAGAFGLVVLADAGNGGLDCWDGRTAGPFLRCLGGFAIGVAACRVFTWPAAVAVARRGLAGWGVCALLAAGLWAGAPDLAIYPLLPTLVLCLASGRGGPAGLLGRGGPVWLGEISYALYLLHIFLLHPLDMIRAASGLALPPAAGDALAAGLILIFLLAASELAHRAVERPARAWLAGLSGRRAGRAGSRSSLTWRGPDHRNLPLPARRVTPPVLDIVTLRTAR